MASNFMLKAILSAVDQISPTLKTVRRGLGMTQKSFRDLAGATRGILGGVGLAGVLSFGAIGYGVLHTAQAAMEYAGAMNDARDATGLALQPLQELQGLFEMGGVSSEEFLQSVTKLNQGLAAAGAGKDDSLLGLLNQMRIPLRDVHGQIRNIDDLLPELADAFKANENPALRTRIAMELFGRAGTKMISVLQEGGEAMKAARAEARRLGTVLSDDAASSLDELGDGFEILNRQLRVQIAEAFGIAAPAIMSAVSGVQEWIAQNKEMLQLKVGAYLTSIAQAFKSWVESGGVERLGNGILRVIDGVSRFVSAMGGLENVLIGVGVLMIAGPLASTVQLAAVLLRMGTYVVPLLTGALTALRAVTVSALLAAAPIVAVVAALAGGAYLLYRNWGTVGPAIMGALSPLMGALGGLRDAVGAYFSAMGDAVMGLVRVIGPVLMPVLSTAFEIFKAIAEFVGGALYLAIVGLTKVIETLVKGLSLAFSIGASVLNFGNRLLGGGGNADVSPVMAGGRMLNAPPPLAAGGSLSASGGLTAAPAARLNGDLRVRFENAPPGMRVDPGRTNQPGLAINPDVGYRNSVMG